MGARTFVLRPKDMIKKSNKDIAIIKNIFEKEVIFYTNRLNPDSVYVEYHDANNTLAFEPLSSKSFHAFISCRYMEKSQKLIPTEYKSILNGYVQKAIYYQNNSVKIHQRLCGSIKKGRIAYNLADRERNVVLVKTANWKCVNNNIIKFISSPIEQAQVIPEGGGNLIELLEPFINLSKDDFLLLLIAIVQSFSHHSSHFVIILSSEKGTGKSTLTQMIRYLIDPSESSLMLTSTNESDLKTALANSYITCFDNTDILSDKYSNILCAAVTGTKEVKRKLYTDSDQVVLNLHNLIILNGIDIVPYKSDLAERSLYFKLLQINPEKRIPDSEFWDNFHKAKPKIMGAIFDTLSKAMELYPTVKTKRLHRMADAHKEMLAIALALGIPEDEFNKIINSNKETLDSAYVQNNSFVTSIADFFEDNGPITDQASKVYETVRLFVGNSRDFPRSASSFTRKLDIEREALNRVDIDFTKIRDSINGNRCKLAIHKKGVTPSMSIPASKKNPSRKVHSILDDDEEEI